MGAHKISEAMASAMVVTVDDAAFTLTPTAPTAGGQSSDGRISYSVSGGVKEDAPPVTVTVDGTAFTLTPTAPTAGGQSSDGREI